MATRAAWAKASPPAPWRITCCRPNTRNGLWYPKLDKFDASIDGIIKRLNEKSVAARIELDTDKVAEGLSEKVIAAGKKQFEGIYLWVLGLVALLAFVVGVAVPLLAERLAGK